MHKPLTLVTLALASLPAWAMMGMPIATGDYFPLVDGARYDYVFVRGPRASATTVVHRNQTWGGTPQLSAMHTVYACAANVACSQDETAF